MPAERGTETSAFGVGRRESHDSSAFYARFTFPLIAEGKDIDAVPPQHLDRIHVADARDMSHIPDNSVALVVTSPPYFAGKEYEQALGQGHVPATYLEYLEMLHDVFKECIRVLEPGGRIAVNVANLGRRPYRSLASDIIHILQDRLGLLLRGEIVWQKARGASGSCAWGSFQSSANPVLRDITERIVVASKGRFDRAVPRRTRHARDLPSEVTIFKDDFMENTLDLWDIPPESAKRIGHPAPFPVELPKRLIDLYTYRGDVVLDPFMGSGSTAVAAIRTSRHFVGFETDEGYARDAERRIKKEKKLIAEVELPRQVRIPVVPPLKPEADYQKRATSEGKRAREIAADVLKDCGFLGIERDRKFGNGVEVNFEARDQSGRRWFFDVSGAFSSDRPGLRRTDTLWKAIGRAAVLKGSDMTNYRLIFLTTDLPLKGSVGHLALSAVQGEMCHDVIPMLSPEGHLRLQKYASGEGWDEPLGELLL